MEPATNKEVIEMKTGIKQKLLLIGVPVLLVGGGLSSIAASAASSPTPTASQPQKPAETAESADPSTHPTPSFISGVASTP